MIVSNVLDPIQPTLDPTVWDAVSETPVLKPQHRDWIQFAIFQALDNHGYSGAEQWANLYLTGSLTTFQYSADSDCDVSLFIDADLLPEWSRAEMIGIMINDIQTQKLPGTTHIMQCYVVPTGVRPEDLYQPGLRSAYSIGEDRWIVPPEHDRSHNVKDEYNGFYMWALEQADKMDRLLRYDPERAVQFWHQIHKKRMRDERSGKGDYSESNILYKFLEQRGLFPAIAQVSGEHVGSAFEDEPESNEDDYYEQEHDKFNPMEYADLDNLVHETQHARNWGDHYDPEYDEENDTEYPHESAPERPIIFDGRHIHVGEPNAYHWDLIESNPELRNHVTIRPGGMAPTSTEFAMGRMNPESETVVWGNPGKWRRDKLQELSEHAWPGIYDESSEMYGDDWHFGAILPDRNVIEKARQDLGLMLPVRVIPTFKQRGGYAGVSRDPITGQDSHLIFVNPKQHAGPKNWSLWHELGHAKRQEETGEFIPNHDLPADDYAASPSEAYAEDIASQHADTDLWKTGTDWAKYYQEIEEQPDPEIIPWQLGKPGKAFLDRNTGNIHTWQTDAPPDKPSVGVPHHTWVADQVGMTYPFAASAWIHPNGNVEFPYLDSEPSTPEEMEAVRNHIQGLHMSKIASESARGIQISFRPNMMHSKRPGTSEFPLIYSEPDQCFFLGPANAYHSELINHTPELKAAIDGMYDPANAPSGYHYGRFVTPQKGLVWYGNTPIEIQSSVAKRLGAPEPQPQAWGFDA